MNEFEFSERLEWSDGHAPVVSDIETVLLNRFPGATKVTRASKQEDVNGTDYFIERGDIPPLSIDVKVRDLDPLTLPNPSDDLALETWSDIERRIPGWTRNRSKRTDCIFWYWPSSRRFRLIPFHALCYVFDRKWESWSRLYRCARQRSSHNGRTWISECVFVPTIEVRKAIERWGSSTVRKTVQGQPGLFIGHGTSVNGSHEFLDTGLPESKAFTCWCGECFDGEVWHCRFCDCHWLADDTECRYCHQAKIDK